MGKADNQADRIVKLMKHLGLNERQFGISIGYPDGKAVGNHRREGRPIGHTFALRVCNAYPQINYNWLVHGEGEMLLTSDDQINEPAESYKRESGNYNDLLTRYNNLVEEFVSLTKKYTRLLEDNKGVDGNKKDT